MRLHLVLLLFMLQLVVLVFSRPAKESDDVTVAKKYIQNAEPQEYEDDPETTTESIRVTKQKPDRGKNPKRKKGKPTEGPLLSEVWIIGLSIAGGVVFLVFIVMVVACSRTPQQPVVVSVQQPAPEEGPEETVARTREHHHHHHRHHHRRRWPLMRQQQCQCPQHPNTRRPTDIQ